jgi:hypothetical protein
MTRRAVLRTIPFAVIATAAFGQEERSNIRPRKKDVPYLLEADKLIETEVQQATQSGSKKEQTFSIPGTTSTARTSLPEPIFLFAPDRISADQLGLYKLQVTNGRREVTTGKRHSDEEETTFRLTLRRLDAGLYRIEAAEMLEPGEYALSPRGSNTAFCFTVY